MNIHKLISEQVNQAMLAVGAPASCKVQVRQSVKTKFGDYQVNGLMATAKQLRMSSYQLANKIVDMLNLDGIARKIDIAGPGFINIFLDSQWLSTQIVIALASPRLGILPSSPQTIVVDYSSPNVAKEMHVGHLRSTIIGDASARILEFLGHNVIRANHIGDWGTNFGMLIAYLEKVEYSSELEIELSSLNHFYRQAKANYDIDPTFAQKARNYVVKLQCGDSYCLQIWRKLVNVTTVQNQKTYDRLNLTLNQDHVMGESMYNGMLPGIVTDLKAKGLAVDSAAGTTLVFLNEFRNKEGKPMGVIIQKKDGAYLYTTIDIACAKYRYETLKADRIIYYVDSRQHQHLLQVWTIVRKAGYVPETVLLEHHMFGMILGKDGKPLKTRTGVTIKLNDLLDEALERARCLIIRKKVTIDIVELELLAQVISIGAVKYAELSKNRMTDYILNWDDMLSFEGNTSLYIQYAYTRIISIFKRSTLNQQQLPGHVYLEHEQEHFLAVCLLQYQEAITIVARNGTPHVLCAYLYNLAVRFSSFYEHCPILNADNDIQHKSRLQLALLTSRTLQHGLNLLGIETVDRM